MILILKGTDLFRQPSLAMTMFGDRKLQFFDRQGWALQIENDKLERDEYDELNPIYVISCSDDGQHQGSLRLMPTTGPTMINDHFRSLIEGNTISNSDTWECTRFCIADAGNRRTAFDLMAMTGIIMRSVGIRNLVAVYDEKMRRKYRVSGISPTQIGMSKTPPHVYAGVWRFDAELLQLLISRSNHCEDAFQAFMSGSPVYRGLDRKAG